MKKLAVVFDLVVIVLLFSSYASAEGKYSFAYWASILLLIIVTIILVTLIVAVFKHKNK